MMAFKMFFNGGGVERLMHRAYRAAVSLLDRVYALLTSLGRHCHHFPEAAPSHGDNLLTV